MKKKKSTNDLIAQWNEAYTGFYKDRSHILKLYPNEFLIRTLLGSYPQLDLDKSRYEGSSILDIGFGDGRNFVLLHDLGFRIFGIEISEGICALARERMLHMGIPATVTVGRNNSIPHPDASFDFLLASGSCYYVDPGTSFNDNLVEFMRVLKPGGYFILTLPKPESMTLEGGTPLGDGHVRIENDPYKLRNGYVYRCFSDQEDIETTFSQGFTNFAFGTSDNNYYGLRLTQWYVVCQRKQSQRVKGEVEHLT